MITIGADPEIFLGSESNSPVSAEGIIPGEKHSPFQADPDIQIMIDNVAAEFAVSPSENIKDFTEKIEKGKGLLGLYAAANGLKILPSISTLFPEDQLQTTNAQTFGCDPDLNIYGRPERKPVHPNLRSVGGHVHLGCQLAIDNPEVVVGLFDLLLGMPLFYYDREWDRASLYGKMGTYRKKEYGVEYRTLSNSWIWSKHLTNVVFERAKYIGEIGDLKRAIGIRNKLDDWSRRYGFHPISIYQAQVDNNPKDIFEEADLKNLISYDEFLVKEFNLTHLYQHNAHGA